MKPELLRRLERLITEAAQDLLQDQQREMAKAFDQLVADARNGQEVVRAYHQGRREERERCGRILRSEQRELTHGSLAWRRVAATLKRIEGEGE